MGAQHAAPDLPRIVCLPRLRLRDLRLFVIFKCYFKRLEKRWFTLTCITPQQLAFCEVSNSSVSRIPMHCGVYFWWVNPEHIQSTLFGHVTVTGLWVKWQERQAPSINDHIVYLSNLSTLSRWWLMLYNLADRIDEMTEANTTPVNITSESVIPKRVQCSNILNAYTIKKLWIYKAVFFT